MELNPEHPVTKELHDQWYKLCAVLLHRLGDNAVITPEEINTLIDLYPDDEPAIIAHITNRNTIELALTSMTEARKKARQ